MSQIELLVIDESVPQILADHLNQLTQVTWKSINDFELNESMVDGVQIVLVELSLMYHEKVEPFLNLIRAESRAGVLFYFNGEETAEIPQDLRAWEAFEQTISAKDLERTFDLALYKRDMDRELVEHSRHLDTSKNKIEQQASQLALMAEELSILKNKEARASHSKSTFIRNVMFQLMGGMNSILGIAQILDDVNLSKENHDYVGSVHYAGANLLGHIQNTLTLTFLENDEVILEEADYQPNQMIHYLLKVYEQELAKKKIVVNYSLKHSEGIWYGNKEFFSRCLFNLLDNGYQFTASGGTIEISSKCLEKNGKKFLAITISNSSLKYPDNLAAAFQQIEIQQDGFLFTQFEKSGIGLFVTNQLLKKTGGALEWNYQNDKTEVTMKIPSLFVENVAEEASDESISVLLVEDNQLSKQVGIKILTKLGCSVKSVENGLKAIDALKKNTFDIILMDCQMPGLDGYAATEKIRSGETGSQNQFVPIIALTASILQEDKDRCKEAGMSDYLGKPILIDNVKAILNKWCNLPIK